MAQIEITHLGEPLLIPELKDLAVIVNPSILNQFTQGSIDMHIRQPEGVCNIGLGQETVEIFFTGLIDQYQAPMQFKEQVRDTPGC